VAFSLAALGVAAYAAGDFHGNPYAGTQFAFGVSGVAVGAYVAYRRPDQPLGWFVFAAGLFSMVTFAGSSILDWMIVNTPDRIGLAKIILHSCTWGWIASRGALVILAPIVSPLGWPRRWWDKTLLALGAAAIMVTCAAHGRLWTFDYFAGEPPTGTARLAESVEPWGHRAIYVLSLVALAGMLTRVVRLDPVDRRRYLPFAIGLAVLAVPSLNSLFKDAYGDGDGFWALADDFEVWTMVAIPVVLAFGILRHRVLDIDVVLRRGTVYGLLAALAVVVYSGVVSLFSLFVQEGSGIGPEVATGLIAVGLLPAHASVERFVAHRVFGNRANPFEVVTALGTRLEQAPPGDQALQLVADTLAEQLRVPFVAIELAAGDSTVEAARAGEPGGSSDRFPLTYQGEHLGALVVGHRSGREPVRAAEQELLSAFARQAGVVAHNAALAQALLQSRSVLVQTREAERRRIRRDLHDGLGPTLATVSLSLGAAAERLHDDPELSSLLHDLEGEIQESIVDIRRLVYDLRPPALDDLGLVGALRVQAGQIGERSAGSDGLAIDVRVAGNDTDLPSAVELAAYRVALEAMTNVVRHARATSCVVEIERNHQLVVRVEDDGVGMAPHAPRGVGVRSMRERAIELGGSLRIEPRVPRGTTVLASFPLDGLLE
jgi:signal transduction histidine kinase